MPERPNDETDEDDRDGFERWVLPYVQESTLWPVLLVLLAHIVAFAAVAILFGVRDRAPVAILVIVLLAGASLRGVRYDWRRSGRPTALSGLLAVIWVMSFVAAYYGDHWRLL